MKFTTTTGSRYEVDAPAKRIRRLGGTSEPTQRQGVDGAWRTYEAFVGPRVGYNAMVVWRFVGDRAESTVTSVVTEVMP